MSGSNGHAPGDPSDQGPTGSFRPAMLTLSDHADELRGELLEGFPSRADLLKWAQRLSVRSLGELPQRFYRGLGREFRYDELAERLDVDLGGGRQQGVLLACLLQPPARDRDLGDLIRQRKAREHHVDPDDVEIPVDELRDAVERLITEQRELVIATYFRPGFDRAYRQLREDAVEYVDEADEGDGHVASDQNYLLMRPGLDELDDRQSRALSMALDGLDEPATIIGRWGDLVEEATEGEINQTMRHRDHELDFVERCYKEPSTRELLTSDHNATRRARELFAAYHLLPAFNRGVRYRLHKSGELPDADRTESERKQI